MLFRKGFLSKLLCFVWTIMVKWEWHWSSLVWLPFKVLTKAFPASFHFYFPIRMWPIKSGLSIQRLNAHAKRPITSDSDVRSVPGPRSRNDRDNGEIQQSSVRCDSLEFFYQRFLTFLRIRSRIQNAIIYLILIL